MTLSLALSPVVPNRLVSAPLSLSALAGGMLLILALIQLLAARTYIEAVTLLQHPTLVTMLRSA